MGMRKTGLLLVLAVLAGCRANPWPDTPPDAPDTEKQRTIEAMYRHYRKDFPDAREMSVAELVKRRTSGDIVLVDTRSPEEYRVSRIEGALPLEAYKANREKYRGKSVVFYCTIGYRSGVIADKERARGVDAYNLKGSILSWLHAGHPVVDDAGITKRVHVYGSDWALAPAGCEMVY